MTPCRQCYTPVVCLVRKTRPASLDGRHDHRMQMSRRDLPYAYTTTNYKGLQMMPGKPGLVLLAVLVVVAVVVVMAALEVED